MKNKQYDYLFKFVMIGNSAVGKSSLLLRFADDQFNENYMITIGVDFRFKSLKVNDKIVKLQIWDTAGQERFRTIVNTYYKNSHAVFMIFDLNNPQTFNDIKSYWINEVTSYTSENTAMILVANKADTQQRQVSEQEIKDFVNERNLIYFQTSAKTGQNVREMFENVAGNLSNRGAVSKGKHPGYTQGQEYQGNQGGTKLTAEQHQKKDGMGAYLNSACNC